MIGITHEYWLAPGVDLDARLKSLTVFDHEGVGNREEKFHRDRHLLLQGLAEEPLNERYHFYLAQTYDGLLQEKEALEWYLKRASMGGFEEERWMAEFRAGKLQLRTSAEEEGVSRLLRAWSSRPQRAEPLATLARYHQEASRYQEAYDFAKAALAIPLPEDELLFVDHRAYGLDPLFDLSVAAYYVSNRPEGRDACEKLLKLRHPNYGLVSQNLTHYTDPLPATERGRYLVPEALRTFDGVVYETSSSTCGHERTLVRLVNYDHADGQVFSPKRSGDPIRTKTAVLEHPGGPGSSPTRISVIDDSVVGSWPTARIMGIEDIRVLEKPGSSPWFTATTCQVLGADGRSQMVLGCASEDWGAFAAILPLQYEHAQSIEKNWIPVQWINEREIAIIYSLDPMVVLAADCGTGQCREVHRGPTLWWPGRFRGSTTCVSTSMGRLCMVHDVSFFPNPSPHRVYSHRWVMLHPTEWRITHYSPPFYLHHHGVEYALGLIDLGRDLLVSYGSEERESHWLKIPMQTALSSLTPTGS